MSSKDSIELQLEGDDITPEKFWELTDDLLYTKVFYDTDTKLYFTKHFKNKYIEKTVTDDTSSDDHKEQKEDKFANDGTNSENYNLEICTEDEINTLLVSFITLVAKYCNTLIAQVGEDTFFDAVAEYLMNFKYYQTHVEFCIRKMLSLLIYSVDLNLHNLNLNVNALDDTVKDEVNDAIDTNEKFIKIIGWIFYKHYVHYKKELLETLKEYSGFTTLCKVLKNYIAISEAVQDGTDMFGNSYKNYMSLMFELCKNYNFSDELKVFQQSDIISLFHNLKVQARDEDEVNFLEFRLLLVLNEQYMFQCGLKVKYEENTNLIVEAMIEKVQYFQVFNEILILNFNREMDRVDQILMLKFLYTVFSNPATNSMVYLNDLKVIVDIIIRQLFNLQIGKAEYLVNIYLRVLYCILTETDLKNNSYKRDELVEVLKYTHSSDDASDKTKILAKRCIDCRFFQSFQNSAETLPAMSKLQIQPDSDRGRYGSCPDLTTKDRIHKIGHETHILLSPAAKLLNFESHIIQQVTRSPTGHHIISPHKVAHTLHLESGKIPFLDHLNLSSSHIGGSRNADSHTNGVANNNTKGSRLAGGSGTPPPPPPRITVHKKQSPLSPLPSGSEPLSYVAVGTSSSIAAPPPPPPSRPYLRSRNVSANDLNCIPQPKPAPPPPAERRNGRHASFDAASAAPELTGSGSGSCSGSPTPPPLLPGAATPPPPPPSRAVRYRKGSIPTFSDPEVNRYYGQGIGNNSDPMILGIRKNDRTISVLSIDSIGSAATVNSESGRPKKPPPPPPPSTAPFSPLYS